MTAANLRFRAIMMTAFAFILGVVPLLIASGAGAASRQSLGTTVFSGMLAATVGTLLVPVFYAHPERRRAPRRAAAPADQAPRRHGRLAPATHPALDNGGGAD